MKQLTKQHLAIALCSLFSSGLAISKVEAANLNNPTIAPILPVFDASPLIAPNIFLTLDDSGSMSNASSKMSYDEKAIYRIPPDPDNFSNNAGDFLPYPLPSGNESGFRQFNAASSNNGYYNAPCGSSNNCKIFKAFYSSRMLTLQSSLALALIGEKGIYSVDYKFINEDKFDEINLMSMNRSSKSYQKNMKTLLKDIYGENANGGTRFRSAMYNLFKGYKNSSGEQIKGIADLALSKDSKNLFLPEEQAYSKEKLLYCKQNYSIMLSDGGYNGKYTINSDYDAQSHNFTGNEGAKKLKWASSLGPVNVNFKGDGTIPEQRLFAGGDSSLYASRPYSGVGYGYSVGDRLSDIVFQQWAEDMNTDLKNGVPPVIRQVGNKTLVDSSGKTVILPEIWNPENDPANWQRIISYAIGLQIGEPWTDESMANIINISPAGVPHTWNLPLTQYKAGGITYNANSEDTGTLDFVRSGYLGRGGFSRVDNSQELEKTFSRIFAEAIQNGKINSVSAGTASTSQVTSASTNILFTTDVNNIEWSGDLYANWMYSGLWERISASGEDISLPSEGKICYGGSAPPNDAFAGQLCTQNNATWSAVNNLPQWQSRNIFSISRGRDFDKPKPNINGTGIVFRKKNLNPTQLSLIDKARTGADAAALDRSGIIKFIRGDNSNVSLNSVRTRADGSGPNKTPLGDFGRGSPSYVGNPNNRIWQLKKGDSKLTRRPMVYAGANDGMLHAFDAKTGVERFAYIPNAVYGNLENLVKTNRPKTAFVDGQISTQDIVDNATPKTILVSGMGAGAKGLFALDITNPDSNFKASNVLWELDEKDDKRLGRIFGKPSIIRVEGSYKGNLEANTAPEQANRWVVVIGTGYNNTTDGNTENGVLVIDAITGKIIDFLNLPSAQGVGEITWVDHQKHKNTTTRAKYFDDDSLWGEADRGYVGDLKGNIWVIDFASDKSASTTLKSAVLVGTANLGGNNDLSRLDISGVNDPLPSSLISGNPAPLFIATDANGVRQPITTRLNVKKHPSNRGYMIYFGTGELFKVEPLVDTRNSLYGIWDDIGDNYADIATKDVENYNLTRNRFYLTYYPWKQIRTAFTDGKSTYARVIDNNAAIPVKSPITWANTKGYKDSVAKQPSRYTKTTAVVSSGWLVDAGRNTSIPQYERVFQSPYTVTNKNNEEGITFLMNTVSINNDPCSRLSSTNTWRMTFRTDVIDGPLARFTNPQSDANGDGVIDDEDAIPDPNIDPNSNPNPYIPLGTADLAAGKKQIEFVPVTTQSSTKNLFGGTGFCPNGEPRSQKIVQDDGTTQEVNICIPRTLSSWSEIE